MTTIDLTAATRAALIAHPHVQASIKEYESIIAAALPIIREELAQQIDDERKALWNSIEATDWTLTDDGRLGGFSDALRIVRGDQS